MSQRKSSGRAAPRGRPARSELEEERARSWATYTLMRSRLTLRQLDNACGTRGSGQWSRYLRGMSSPAPEKLSIVEAIVPGTARCYESPMWSFIDPWTMGTLNPRAIYEWLDEPLKSRFCMQVPSHSFFWRTARNLYAETTILLETAKRYERPFDVVAGLLGLTHEAVIHQNQQAFHSMTDVWADFFKSLGSDPKLDSGIWSALPQALIEDFSGALEVIVKASGRNGHPTSP